MNRIASYSSVVLLTTFVILLFNSGMRFSLGLLLVPMAESLQWSRTELSSMATVFMLVTASALPFTGQLVDRLGPFRVLTFGVVLAGVALVLTSQISEPWHGFLTYGLMFAVASAATSITPVGVILTRAFPQRAGLANSIAISGMGVGQLLIISLLAAFLVQTGWRSAYIGLGVVSIAILLPLLYWASRMHRLSVLPEHSKPSPDIAHPAKSPAMTVPQSAATEAVGPQTAGRASYKANTEQAAGEALLPKHLRDTLTIKPLWLLFAIYAICGFQDFFVATHIVALAVDADVSVAVAGQMLAFMGLAGLAGVLLAGVMADRYGPASVTLLCFVLRCGLFVAMLMSREAAVIVSAALLYGSTFWMTAPLTVVFARQLVGAGLLGSVTGLITMVHHGAGGLGAAFGAIGFDRNGDYHSGLVMMLILSLFATLLTVVYHFTSPRE